MISTPVLTGMKILVPMYSGVRYAAYHARNSDEVRLTLHPILLKQRVVVRIIFQKMFIQFLQIFLSLQAGGQYCTGHAREMISHLDLKQR